MLSDQHHYLEVKVLERKGRQQPYGFIINYLGTTEGTLSLLNIFHNITKCLIVICTLTLHVNM